MKSNVFSIEQLLKMDDSAIEGEFFKKEYKQYRIPLYQREYKWDSYRALELLEDIKAKKKLLGIVLFDSNTKDKVYEIVDGQQRITTLFFILIELYNLLEKATIEQGTIIKTIKNEEKYILDNKSFGNDFIIEEDNKLCIDIKNDIYYQKENIKAVISSIRDNLNNCPNKEDVLSNLLGSQLVVIINEDAAGAFQDPVEQIFLDINEKSQGLDSEDIFKGYCFKNFGGRNIEVLKKDWEKLKKKGMSFVNTFMPSFSMSKFLYHYVLMNECTDFTEKLTLNGKHYLSGKNSTSTHNLLEEMSFFANTILEMNDNVKNSDYLFLDMCTDIKAHKKEDEVITCKRLCEEILNIRNIEYPRFPFYYFVNVFKKREALSSNISVADFRRIINDLYIYTFLFVYNSGRKSKESIDYTVRDALRSKDEIIIEQTKKATTTLRKDYLKNCALKSDMKKFESLAFYYSIIDFYDLQKMALKDKYTREKEYNIEHFIMMDSKGIDWVNKDGSIQKFKVSDVDFWKECKRYTIDYLIINEDLNEKMDSHDVVKKIEEIEEWYVGRTIPKHVQLYIDNITALNSYKELVRLKEKRENDKEIIIDIYMKFLKEYFSENNRVILEKSIWDSVINAFK